MSIKTADATVEVHAPSNGKASTSGQKSLGQQKQVSFLESPVEARNTRTDDPHLESRIKALRIGGGPSARKRTSSNRSEDGSMSHDTESKIFTGFPNLIMLAFNCIDADY